MKENDVFDFEQIKKLANTNVRTEYLITKNQKLRTFISPDSNRKNLVAELYEVTKGVVTPEDTLDCHRRFDRAGNDLKRVSDAETDHIES